MAISKIELFYHFIEFNWRSIQRIQQTRSIISVLLRVGLRICPRRRPWMIKRTVILHTLHVSFFLFLYISQPLSFSGRSEMTCFAVLWTTWAVNRKFSFFSCNLQTSYTNLIPEEKVNEKWPQLRFEATLVVPAWLSPLRVCQYYGQNKTVIKLLKTYRDRKVNSEKVVVSFEASCQPVTIRLVLGHELCTY